VLADAVGYDLSVYGPNGFYRRFKGGISGRHRANLDVRAIYSDENGSIALEVANRASHTTRVSIFNGYKSQNIELVLGPGEAEARSRSLTRTSGWYDLAILAAGDQDFECRFAGHVENGEDSISDPAMGGLV
jgi:phospholipase C